MALTDNLEVYAKYDDDLLDASGAGRHGTGVNSPTFATGKLGDCLHTTAASSQSVTHGTSVGTDSVSAMSWSVWVKPTAIGSFRTIAVKGATTNTSRIILCCGGGGAGSSSAVMCGMANGANSFGFTANSKLVNGTWVHIVMTFDGSQVGDADRLKCYVNGVQEPLTFVSVIPATTANNSADPLRAGATTGAGFYWDGDIDEWGTWSRALTGAEVTQLYNGGAGLAFADFGPAGPFPQVIISSLDGRLQRQESHFAAYGVYAISP